MKKLTLTKLTDKITVELNNGKESESINYPIKKEKDAWSQFYKWDKEFIGKNKRIWAEVEQECSFESDEVVFTALYNDEVKVKVEVKVDAEVDAEDEDDEDYGVMYLLKQPIYFYDKGDDDYEDDYDVDQYNESETPIVEKYEGISDEDLADKEICDPDYDCYPGNNNNKVIAPGDNYFIIVEKNNGTIKTKEAGGYYNNISGFDYIGKIQNLIKDKDEFEITVDKIEV